MWHAVHKYYDEMNQLHKDGMTFSQIGSLFGITKQAVHQTLKRGAAATGNGPSADFVLIATEAVLVDLQRRKQDIDKAIVALEAAHKVIVTIRDN